MKRLMHSLPVFSRPLRSPAATAAWTIRSVRNRLNTLTHDGITRTFLLHVPASYSSSRRVALIVGLHGYTPARPPSGRAG